MHGATRTVPWRRSIRTLACAATKPPKLTPPRNIGTVSGYFERTDLGGGGGGLVVCV